MQKLKEHKRLVYVILIILILCIIYLIYNFIINPRNELGNRCETSYNQSTYKLVSGELIEIPNNSCFVSECCSHTATFRSKKKIEDLKNELATLEEELNTKYPDMEFNITVSEHNFYNEYYITYSKK